MKPVQERIKKSLDYSVKDGCAWGVMDGMGSNYVSPFALSLGANEMHIGLLSSLPNLLGSIAQPVGAWFSKFFKNRIAWISLGVVLQALMWLPAFFIPYFFGDAGFVIVFFSLIAVFGSAISASWTSLIADLVPARMKGEYFGKRNKLIGLVSLSSMLAAGFILWIFSGNVFLGFGIIFFIAFVSRLISAYYLTKHYDPPNEWEKSVLGPVSFYKSVRKKSFWKFMKYYALIYFSTAIAGPFFNVYALRNLGFDYITYAIVMLVIPSLARTFSMPYWGKLGDWLGNRAVISVTGFLVPSIPLLWLLSKDVWFLSIAQVISGFAWAGFELAAFNYLLDSVPKMRGTYAAYFNFLNGTGVFFGAFIGGFILTNFSSFSLFSFTGIPLVFLFSGILRYLVSIWFVPRLKEVGSYKTYRMTQTQLFIKLALVYPTKAIATELTDTGASALRILGKNYRKINKRLNALKEELKEEFS